MQRYLFACFTIFIAVTPVLPDWTTNLEKNGIRIETRAVSGSAYKEFRATMTAKTSMAKVQEVMQDIPAYATWMKDCKEARRIRKNSENSGVVYSLQATPWPIVEREAVVEYQFRKQLKPPEISITLTAVPEIIPQTPGKVRISRLAGSWQFRALGAGEVQIVYSLHTEPGGNLPS